jgi:hypothetical protein
MASRVAQSLESGPGGTQLHEGIGFLRRYASEFDAKPARRVEATPLDRLSRSGLLDETDIDLLVFAGLADEHEGFAALFRALHPRGEPRPSVSLAAQVLSTDAPSRLRLRQRLEAGPLARWSLLQLGDGPFFERSLFLPAWLWGALHGLGSRPSIHRLSGTSEVAGLSGWFESADSARAIKAIQRDEPVTVVVSASHPDVAFERALALVSAAGREPGGTEWVGDTLQEAPIVIASLTGGTVPVVRIPTPEGPAALPNPSFEDAPGVVVVASREGSFDGPARRPVLPVPVGELSISARRQAWAERIPSLAQRASWLAARFPLEPALVKAISGDVRAIESLDGRQATVDDVLASVRSRTSRALSAGVQLIRPTARWDDLILPPDRKEQLQEAVARLDSQEQVLGEWGFLKGRTGARGVRMLFAGPPGTGKTYGAEVMANQLNADLLLVDISRVVSKWIGETERNLAQVFDAAEQTRAVLFFDEADALFGRRTEVSDAHDRYANLETAYLLSRLERYEGLAILATNLRSNIDPAFLRRIEFVVDFQEPDREDRVRLWTRHLPEGAPRASDVNLYEFAAAYPMSGAVIRNAATAAGFLAARDGLPIERTHILHAIRREYEKSGRAFTASAVKGGAAPLAVETTTRGPRSSRPD